MLNFFKKRKEAKSISHSTTAMPVKCKAVTTHINRRSFSIPSFKNDPQEYTYCRDYVENLETFFEIDCQTNSHYHYIALNKTKQQLIEIHTRVLGFVEETSPQKYVLDFVNPPREITIEDFLDIAEKSYKGIRVLYHDISKDNLSLYKDTEKEWYWYQPVRNSKATVPCQSKILYQFKQPHAARCDWKNKSEIYPLVAIAEFLVGNDFVFEWAIIGGGITEISHTGTVSYDAKYINLADFRDNFKRDLNIAREKVAKEYNGWACLDYRNISVKLKCGKIELWAKIGDEITMIWNNITAATQPLIDKTNQKMIDILGKQVELRKRFYVEQQPRK